MFKILCLLLLLGTSLFASDNAVILFHPGPARHWAEFYGKGDFTLYAAGDAAHELQQAGVPFTRFDPKSEDFVATIVARRVITDCGHPMAIKMQQQLEKCAPKVERVIYYDNPEPFVPGGYSQEVAKAMPHAQVVLFANKQLVGKTLYQSSGEKINLDGKKLIGLGYYPLKDVEKIKKLRGERADKRGAFLAQHGLKDTGQKIVVYFGGANEEYYTRAFPAFCNILTSLSSKDIENVLFVIQQHPRAGDRDIKQLAEETPRYIVSKEKDSDAVLGVADLVLYYQTSASPKFVLSGIPTIQIAHEPFNDIVVSAKIVPSVCGLDHFLEVFYQTIKQMPTADQIADAQKKMGLDPHWQERLQAFLKS